MSRGQLMQGSSTKIYFTCKISLLFIQTGSAEKVSTWYITANTENCVSVSKCFILLIHLSGYFKV